MSTIATYSASRLMPVPIETVWEITGAPTRNAEWVNNVEEVFGNEGEAFVGDRFRERSVVVGRWTSITEWTLVTIEEHHERTFVGSGFPGVGEVRPFLRFTALTDRDERSHTQVTYGSQLTVELGPLSGAFARLLRPMVTAEFADSLVNLERLAIAELNRAIRA